MIGRWFKRTGKRDEVFIATKFGNIMENHQFKGMNSSAEYCKEACDKSLKRLGTDYIDLCQYPRFALLCPIYCTSLYSVLTSYSLCPWSQSRDAHRGDNARDGRASGVGG